LPSCRLRDGAEWGGRPMPQYIMLVNFTDQGLRGVKDVPNRQDKSRETAKQFGVERKTVWMTFGPYDFVHLYEAPNDEAMAKFVMTIASFGKSQDDRYESMGRIRTPSTHTGIVVIGNPAKARWRIMKRREFITLLGGAAAAWPLAARAQQQPKTLRVGFVGMQPRDAPHYANFLKRMAELGYQEG